MKKLALTAAAALLLAACGQKSDSSATADAIRMALPQGDALKIDAPDTTKAATNAPERLAGAVQQSDLARVSYLFATGVNAGVYSMLLRLQLVTLFPPTSCVEDVSCTWGPGLGDDTLNVFKLVVTRNDTGGFDYALSGAPVATGSTAFVDVIAGTAFPGEVRGRGHGTFTIGFDAAAQGLAHPVGWTQQDFGSLFVQYDARQGLNLQCSFANSRNADDPGTDPTNPNRVDAYYDFAGGAGAGGNLQIAWRTLPLDATSESFSLHTRWTAEGAGRADVEAIVPAGTYQESECWFGAALSFQLAYDSNPATGAESLCAYQPAVYLPFPDPFPPL